MAKSREKAVRRVAMIGSCVPRQCGIAEFHGDLCDGLDAVGGAADFFQVAVNDLETGYAYPSRVHFEMAEKEIASYRRAADFLNINNVDLMCLQHEFGLYGGVAGSHVIALLRELRMPIVSTLHTVLREPDDNQRKVMTELSTLSDKLITMSHRGREFLRDVYKIADDNVLFIPHGIPDVPFVDPNFYKDQFGVLGKQVIMTFGLLSPNKGIERVIEALPKILTQCPDAVYVIVGATHPNLRRQEGEAYRLSLEQLTHELGVEGNVVFHNRFVSKQELMEFLGAADLYVTPYPNEAQITSGTLAYAVGTGKAVLSTPYWYAEELLAEGRGQIVPFKDTTEAIAEHAIRLLKNETARTAMRKAAYLYGRDMVWQNVAGQYLKCFEQVKTYRTATSRTVTPALTLDKRPRELPLLKLGHLLRLTDNTGILQHAIHTVPNLAHGYTTDDNARALIFTVLAAEVEGEATQLLTELSARYLAFLNFAFDEETGSFRNYLSYDRQWQDNKVHETAHARALWALGILLGRSRDEGLRGQAGQLFSRALATALEFTSPRGWAFALIGIHDYLRKFSGDREAQTARVTLAERLLECYRRQNSDQWHWFEEYVGYANAKLSHAMLLCGQWLKRSDMSEVGLESLDWLTKLQRPNDGYFAPVGSIGFYPRGGNRARFDQQPLEAYDTISACLEAFRMTGESRWYKEAQVAFDWFIGRNDLRQALYDPTTGGCRDGLHPDRVNLNQGAESTLAFLRSLMEMRLAENVIKE